MMYGPRVPAEPARITHVQRRQRRARARTRGAYQPDATVHADPIDRPVTPEKVRIIASEGYPLWEPLAVMQLRNRRITVGYSDLSERLARLVAGRDERWDANWCTYATWSSKTIGSWIEHDAAPYPVRKMRRVPFFVRHALIGMCQYLVRRDDGATYRSLAAGNRFVFLEIGLSIASFIEAFGRLDRRPGARPDDAAWDAYWEQMQGVLHELGQLDPSWMLTNCPEPTDLRLGLRQYFEALYAPNAKARAELVLAGNLLIGAYEQRRVDGYVAASLALFTKRATRALVRHRTGKLARGRLRRRLTGLYGRLSTFGLVLKTHDEVLRIGKPLVPPPEPGTELFPDDLEAVSTPLLQALLTRYDTTEGRPRRRRGRNWACYEDRMNYIANLFRSRQRHTPLFVRPFEQATEKALLQGRIEPDPQTSLPDDYALPDIFGTPLPMTHVEATVHPTDDGMRSGSGRAGTSDTPK